MNSKHIFSTFNAFQIHVDRKSTSIAVLQFQSLAEDRFVSGSLLEVGFVDGYPVFDLLWVGLLKTIRWPFSAGTRSGRGR